MEYFKSNLQNTTHLNICKINCGVVTFNCAINCALFLILENYEKNTYGGPVLNGDLELEKTGAFASTPFETGR
jgi:hypothetical protein